MNYRHTLGLLLVLLISAKLSAFCGFYVAKADIALFNKTSQVILVRNGEKTTVTMSSDFEGDVKDFAMVVPVPVILQQGDVKVVERGMFDRFDAYSGPRLVSYRDADPCYQPVRKKMYKTRSMDAYSGSVSRPMFGGSVNQLNYHVTVEAKYTVGEYDILILSAEDSGGLERWLNDNGYKIPKGAKEVLDPYIKSNLKFFVVKVNLDEQDKRTDKNLRPIQITYNSPKFMLPIRLGMANATGPQDMIVYALSNVGRVETTNYRTVEMTTNKNVPLFVKDEFGKFYKALYDKAWEREGKNVAFLEYAWNVGSAQPVKCDPCISPAPVDDDLRAAGVDWITNPTGSITPGQVYFTRMHITYSRKTFPQDLMLQETPNKENYQARYIIRYPARNFECALGQSYLVKLRSRRKEEMQTLALLTGWDTKAHHDYVGEYDKYLLNKDGSKKGSLLSWDGDENDNSNSLVTLLSALSIVVIIYTLTRKPLPQKQ